MQHQACVVLLAPLTMRVTPPEAPPAAWGFTRAPIRVSNTERVQA